MADDETTEVPQDDSPHVPRYILKDENGRKFESDDPSDGVVVCDLRPE